MVLNSPRGTADLYGKELTYRNFILEKSKKLFNRFCYDPIVTPAFEHTEVFSRSIGQATDIVQKEMYTFYDKKQRSLTLRPEGTAGVVRAVVENKLYAQNLPIKLFYAGNMFRYERPQKGRMREFFQLGAEAIGSANPLMDAEMIWLISDLFSSLGFKDLVLLINSMGCTLCRKSYTQKFQEFLHHHQEKLCPECRHRLDTNPLRVFDCKRQSCRHAIEDSPKISQHLCSSCRDHFEKVRRYIKILGINCQIDHSLVRGFDYYSRTVFEVVSTALDSAQNALGGGGRYDDLVKQFGGPDLPAIGFAIGLDRTSLLMQQLGIKPSASRELKSLYLISMDQQYSEYLLELLQFFRKECICDTNFNIKNISKELKWAQKHHYDFVAIIGEEEFKNCRVSIKDMQKFKQHAFDWKNEKDTILALLRGN